MDGLLNIFVKNTRCMSSLPFLHHILCEHSMFQPQQCLSANGLLPKWDSLSAVSMVKLQAAVLGIASDMIRMLRRSSLDEGRSEVAKGPRFERRCCPGKVERVRGLTKI